MKKVFILTFLLSAILALVSCEKHDFMPAVDHAGMVDLTFLAISDADDADRNTLSISPASLKPIRLGNLPASVLRYIASEYEGATTIRAASANNGAFVVQIQLMEGLLATLQFDAAGTFMPKREVEVARMGTKTESWAHCQPREIPASSMSRGAGRYPGATVERAAIDAAGCCRMVMKTTNGRYVGMAFDAEGNMRSEVMMQMQKSNCRQNQNKMM